MQGNRRVLRRLAELVHGFTDLLGVLGLRVHAGVHRIKTRCQRLLSPPLIDPPLSPTLAARPPPSARRTSGRCELAKAAAAGRERAGGPADGGAWTTGWAAGGGGTGRFICLFSTI